MRARGLVAGILFLALDAPVAYAQSAVAEVNAVLDGVVGAWERSDVQGFESLMAKEADVVNFGTDAAERFVGYDALRTSMVKQFATYTGTKVKSRDRVVKVAGSGTVAWASEVMDLTTRSGGETVSLQGMRVTNVLEKRGGKWLIVHFHYSVPVAGQAIKY